eukprot:2527910-Pleurochrysis_carterae.AAC.1
MFFRLDPTYSFNAPSPTNPTFPVAQSTGTGSATSGPAAGTRSGATTAAPAAAPPQPVSNVPSRTLTADERA